MSLCLHNLVNLGSDEEQPCHVARAPEPPNNPNNSEALEARSTAKP